MKLICWRNLMFEGAHLTSKTTPPFPFLSPLLLDELFKTISTLFPRLFESINHQRWCVIAWKLLNDYLIFFQVSVIAAGQAVYDLGKKVQWMYPSHYNGIVWMMGPSHVDMAFLCASVDWLEVCGLTESLEKAEINTLGRAESLLDGSKIERFRHAHQIF